MTVAAILVTGVAVSWFLLHVAYFLDRTPHMGGRKWWWSVVEWRPW